MTQHKRRLIGISGPTASGKSTIARGLIEHFGADTNRFSKILAEIATKLGIETNKASLQNLSTVLRTTLGEDVLVRAMCEWVRKCQNNVIVIEGIRRIVDCELLAEVAKSSEREWILLYVDVPYAERFNRLNGRLKSEGVSPITEEAFHQLDTQECEDELPELHKSAHYPLTNLQSAKETTEQALVFLGNDA